MKCLNKKARETFLALVDGVADLEAKKIDNTNGAFMPVCVEHIFNTYIGRVFSIAHYFEQNSDLCKDPDMTFLLPPDGEVYPLSFQQDIPPIYQEAAIIEENELKVRQKMQADLASFANTWMENIKHQQGIDKVKV